MSGFEEDEAYPQAGRSTAAPRRGHPSPARRGGARRPARVGGRRSAPASCSSTGPSRPSPGGAPVSASDLALGVALGGMVVRLAVVLGVPRRRRRARAPAFATAALVVPRRLHASTSWCASSRTRTASRAGGPSEAAREAAAGAGSSACWSSAVLVGCWPSSRAARSRSSRSPASSTCEPSSSCPPSARSTCRSPRPSSTCGSPTAVIVVVADRHRAHASRCSRAASSTPSRRSTSWPATASSARS